jgi:hypothetical protein
MRGRRQPPKRPGSPREIVQWPAVPAGQNGMDPECPSHQRLPPEGAGARLVRRRL